RLRNESVAHAKQRLGRARGACTPGATRLRGGGSPPRRSERTDRSSGRDHRRPATGRSDRGGADLLQLLAARRSPREPSTSAAARPSAAEPDVVGDYQRALAAGDVDAIVATFEPGGY